MPRSTVLSRPRAHSQIWPRAAVLALVGIVATGCSDSARFDSNPYASNRQAPPQQQEVTGSIGSRPVSSGRIEAQPLPAPSRPASVAAPGGVANGAQGLGAYRPGAQNYSQNSSDVTGSVAARQVPASNAAVPPPPKPAGEWTWDGGSPVTVGYGESVETIARKHGVPVSALMQTNGISNPASIKPGQRLVIPRYVTVSTPQAPVASAPTHTSAAENAHIVAPGESLIGIARRHGVALTALARANNIQPYSKINIGDRLAVPGGRRVAARQTAAPLVAQPRSVAVERVASAPAQNARIATQEPPTTETVVKSAEAAGPLPSFRWPVRGRVIAGFGPKTNGAQNDGINLAVPEGTPIKAADDGVVAYSGNELKGYGNLVLIRHANGFVSAYAHASELLVKRGDTIKRGQVIAHAGQTGNVTSPQLHFEIRKGSTPVDPTKYLGGA
jgi:murein DD-endopeptidase MepM/ murein hydrolase activator NlpD